MRTGIEGEGWERVERERERERAVFDAQFSITFIFSIERDFSHKNF